MQWFKGIAAKIGAEKMAQLLDRIICRLFHRRFHTEAPGDAVAGWRFIRCSKCNATWPERKMPYEHPT
jgi:hypothetical protein